MPSDKKQYGSKQEGPALSVGDFKGNPVQYPKSSPITPGPYAASVKSSDHQKG
jgi:hypothetical protein|tara:strand:+ start:430 stop:588 length:159 start_codon:yes stop_codon:yes gene_type:complete